MIDKLLKVLLVSVLMFCFAGCYGKPERVGAPPPAPAVKYTIAVLPYGGHDAFWKQFREGAKKAAADAGYSVRWESPPPVWTPKTQAEMLKNVLNLNPPGIVLGPLHRNLLQSALVATVKMNIPIVIAVSNEDTSYKITYVGSDNAVLGADLAKSVGKLTPSNGMVAVIKTQEGMRSVDTRQHSLLETLSQSFSTLQTTQVPFPVQDDLNYDESNLQKIMKNSLQQFLETQTDVKAVVTLDENSTLAAWQILKAIPRDHRPLLFGVSVDPDLVAACHKGEIAALVVQDARKMGVESARAIIGFKDGKRPPQQILIPYKIINAGS